MFRATHQLLSVVELQTVNATEMPLVIREQRVIPVDCTGGDQDVFMRDQLPPSFQVRVYLRRLSSDGCRDVDDFTQRDQSLSLLDVPLTTDSVEQLVDGDGRQSGLRCLQ